MITSTIVYIVSCVAFIISILVLCLKKKNVAFLFRFSFFWVIITIVIANLFFPLYHQREAILQGAYPIKIQSFEFFPELRKILEWSYPENLPIFLREYLFSSVIPVVCIGVLLGFLIKMNVKTWIRFFLISFFVCILIEALKLLVCTILQAWYLIVTPEDALYLWIGCMLGSLILCLIRKIFEKLKFQHRIMVGFQNAICCKSKHKAISQQQKEADA